MKRFSSPMPKPEKSKTSSADDTVFCVPCLMQHVGNFFTSADNLFLCAAIKNVDGYKKYMLKNFRAAMHNRACKFCICCHTALAQNKEG